MGPTKKRPNRLKIGFPPLYLAIRVTIVLRRIGRFLNNILKNRCRTERVLVPPKKLNK